MSIRHTFQLTSVAAFVCVAIGCNGDKAAPASSVKQPSKPNSGPTSISKPGAAATDNPKPPSMAGMAAPSRTEDAAVPQKQAGDCKSGTFDSTFAAIQQVVFAGNKCTNDACHGAAAVGGLDLRPDAAYKS